MDNNYTTSAGKTIKAIRTRLKISQLEFENILGLANGSLSKLEADKKSPSKETILKIINTFNITAYESFLLMNISMSKIADIIDLINRMNLDQTERKVAETAANNIPKILNLLGASVNLLYKDDLKSEAVTLEWYSKYLPSVLSEPFKTFTLSTVNSKTNLLIKSVNENIITSGKYLADFTFPYLSHTKANTLQKEIGIKSVLCVPLTVRQVKIGCILYAKGTDVAIVDEVPLLIAFSRSVAIKIYNVRNNVSKK